VGSNRPFLPGGVTGAGPGDCLGWPTPAILAGQPAGRQVQVTAYDDGRIVEVLGQRLLNLCNRGSNAKMTETWQQQKEKPTHQTHVRI
jgi:hypothetical protein